MQSSEKTASSAPRRLACSASSRMRAELPSKSPTVGLNWARAIFMRSYYHTGPQAPPSEANARFTPQEYACRVAKKRKLPEEKSPGSRGLTTAREQSWDTRDPSVGPAKQTSG